MLMVKLKEGNISLDQKLAEYHGAATRFPSMTLGVRERNLLSFTRTGVQVPNVSMQQEGFRAMLYYSLSAMPNGYYTMEPKSVSFVK